MRSLLVAVGIAEACRLRPRAPPYTPTAAMAARDKFDRAYDEGAGPAPA